MNSSTVGSDGSDAAFGGGVTGGVGSCDEVLTGSSHLMTEEAFVAR